MNIQPLIAQLEAIISDYSAMTQRSAHNDLSDLPKPDRQAVVTRAIAAVQRISGKESVYDRDVQRILVNSTALHVHTSSIVGVVKALLFDVKAGYMESIVELIHAETFGDYLEMAVHLNEAGFKDAAAVIGGSTLEVHLRALCAKYGVPIVVKKPGGSVTSKKTEIMNADLCSAGTYNKLEQKNVTAWLDLRNKAAHGQYSEYSKDQVSLLLDSIRAFMSRVPA